MQSIKAASGYDLISNNQMVIVNYYSAEEKIKTHNYDYLKTFDT